VTKIPPKNTKLTPLFSPQKYKNPPQKIHPNNYRSYSISCSLSTAQVPRPARPRIQKYTQIIQKRPQIIQTRPQTLQKDLKNENKGQIVIFGGLFVIFGVFIVFF
jgi:hypothetical protein